MAAKSPDHLILRFLPEQFPFGKVEWSIEGKETIGSGAEESSAELVRFRNRNWAGITVLVPGELVRTFLLTLSPEQRRHRDMVVPALLEEELAEDIEEMHITILPERPSGVVKALAIRSSELEALSGVMKETGLEEYGVMPDYWPLTADVQGKTHLLQDGNRWIGCFGNGEGLSSDTGLLSHLLRRYLAQSHEVVVLHRPAPSAEHKLRDALDNAGLNHIVVEAEEEAAELPNITAWLAARMARLPSVPSLVARPDISRPVLIRSSALALGLLAAYFLVWGAEIFYYQWKARQYASEYTKSYQHLFPGEAVLDDPGDRIAQVDPAKFLSGGQQAAFLRECLARIARARAAATMNNVSYSLRFEKMTYEADTREFVLVAHSLDPAMLEVFTRTLDIGEDAQPLYFNQNYAVTRFIFRGEY